MTKKTKLIYFTEEVHKYMQISDLIITKPGGLTVSESIVCSLPMAIYSAYPGQEECNAKFLKDIGVAVKLGKNAGEEINKLLNDEHRLMIMSENCKKQYNGNASEHICKLAHSLTENNK